MTLAGHDFFKFSSVVGDHVLLVDGSRIYDLNGDDFLGLSEEELARALERELPIQTIPYVDDTPLLPPAIRALSLNVAQSCNLACTYCYADEGRFGGKAARMEEEIAFDAVRLLVSEAGRGEDVVLGFMGGEPLLNRGLLHRVVPFAAEEAGRHGVRMRFSITTNATLVRDEDAQLFHDHDFTVAVSLDGDSALNDLQRPTAKGRSSYSLAVAGLAKLLALRPRHLSIRATVTPGCEDLPATLEHLISLGVDEVGFAPVLTAPSLQDEFQGQDFEVFLEQMIACGDRAKRALLTGERYPFGNFETALQEIARGSHRPYACGAAASYASVGANGDLFACHRAIDDDRFAIGSLGQGLDNAARTKFLADHHVTRQAPCTTCWARQLCGGGCHQEVARRGRVHCDYVRGWLAWCLSAYAEVSEQASDYLIDARAWFAAGSLPEHDHVQ